MYPQNTVIKLLTKDIFMLVLGLETSCDETSAAIVNDERHIYSNVVYSQIEQHRPYGGVVPEIAARSHLNAIDEVIKVAMMKSSIKFNELDGIAATGGPGLIGGLLVGIMTAKALSFVHNLPFVAVNHLEGHALTIRLTGDENGNNVPFPFLLLLLSGGHSQILIVRGVGKYQCLGTTMDDALGEVFDKSAKMMGLKYPGGPQIEKFAKYGDPNRFKLPRPLKGRKGCDFSFSGLKTKIRQTIENLPPGELTKNDINDLCASFQMATGDVLEDRCHNAIKTFLSEFPNGGYLVIAGGVASNLSIRERIMSVAKQYGLSFASPPPELCTDNAGMIAWAGIEKLRNGDLDSLNFNPKPRWPLDPKQKT